MTRSTTYGGRPGTNAAASARARPSTSSEGSPFTEAPGAPSRTAKSITTPSARSRRAAKVSMSTDGWSSHCASSTRHSSGPSAAASDRSVRTASPTLKRSRTLSLLRPNTERRAAAWASGSASTRSITGRKSWCRPPKAISISDSMPSTRNTRAPCACPAAWSSSAVFPMPASPCTSRTPLVPRRASASNCSIRSRSAYRPRTTYPARLRVPITPPGPDGPRDSFRRLSRRSSPHPHQGHPVGFRFRRFGRTTYG